MSTGHPLSDAMLPIAAAIVIVLGIYGLGVAGFGKRPFHAKLRRLFSIR